MPRIVKTQITDVYDYFANAKATGEIPEGFSLEEINVEKFTYRTDRNARAQMAMLMIQKEMNK